MTKMMKRLLHPIRSLCRRAGNNPRMAEDLPKRHTTKTHSLINYLLRLAKYQERRKEDGTTIHSAKRAERSLHLEQAGEGTEVEADMEVRKA